MEGAAKVLRPCSIFRRESPDIVLSWVDEGRKKMAAENDQSLVISAYSAVITNLSQSADTYENRQLGQTAP